MPPPPRPASSRSGGAASAGGTPSSASGLRSKEADKQPGTFFLGRYRVVDEIGVGGMASVHLARMDGPGGFQKWVAIKRIHPHLVEDDQFVDMFLDEARIAAGINHANVAQVFDLGKDDNTYWIAMEYLHGEPLREVMRRAEERHMRIKPDLAARICADAADGLHAAHELRGKSGQLLGLVHRDVTPHNLFLTYEGYTKVVDFGIAKVADRLSSTRAGTLKGKLAYMSPEQVRGAEVDRTTDIFALGVVLWELTTNQRLFRMDTDLDTLEKVQACVVPPPSTIMPGYPPELEACVMKALSKRKQDRFATAREFSRALQAFLMRSGSFCGPEEVSTFVREVFADRIQKRDAHLAWAAEVTSTINVDQLRAAGLKLPGSADDDDRDEDDARARPGGNAALGTPVPMGGHQAPSSGARPMAAPSQSAQMAAMSLMDDDEDVPTTVAMREQIEQASRNGPRPAAGMRAPQVSFGAQPAVPQNGGARPAFGGAPASPSQQQPQYNQGGYGQAPRQQAPYGQPPPDDRNAQSGGSADDLGATVALPLPSSEPERPRPAGGQPYGQYGPAPGNGGQVSANANPTLPSPAGQGYAPAPQPQLYGYAPQQAPAPHYGPQGAQSQQYSNHMPPLAPQSQIETALSLPRPDPASLWLAQQEKQRGERRNNGVLIAVVALTALCVIGIGALVYFKLHNAPTSPTTPEAQPSATASVEVAPSASAPPAPVATETAAAAITAAPTATAAATVAAPTPPAAPAAPGPAAPAPANNGGAAAAAAAAAAAKEKA
ncbi:MAG: protein kinase domain-containing protein, partial [Byssovorax sp.]